MELSRVEKNVNHRLELVKQKEYLNMSDVQLLTGYSYSTIRRRIDEGKLKAYQNSPKAKILLKKQNVIDWMENGQI